MILVVGATGLVGSEVCRQLRDRGEEVRAVIRSGSDPEKVARLRGLGCTTVVADLRDRATLDAACAGVDAVVTTVSAMPFSWNPPESTVDTVDRAGQTALIEAAAAAGVRHLTYLSITPDLDFPLRNAKRAVEAHLKESGLEYTILRPTCFAEVWLSPALGFDAAGGRATVYGTGDRPISFISLADVASFVVASLTHPVARNATIELGGPQALRPSEVVRIFEEVTGTPIEVTVVPEEALEAQQAAATDDMGRSLAGLMRSVAAGDAIDMTATLRDLPITLHSVREYAMRTLATVPVPTA